MRIFSSHLIRLLIVFLFCTSGKGICSFSQSSNKADSLLLHFKSIQNVKDQSKMGAKAVRQLVKTDPKLATQFFPELRRLTQIDTCKSCLANYFGAVGSWFYEQKELDSSLHYYRLLLEESKKNGDITNRIIAMLKVTSILKIQNKTEESRDIVLEAISGFSDSLKTPGLKEFSNQIANQVTQQSAEQLLKEEREKAFKKEQKLKLERIYWSLGIGVLILAIVGLIYYVSRKKKENRVQQDLLNFQLNSLVAQMNPHFIFNCLNSIKGLVITNEKEKAADYLTDFSKLLRHTLENSSNTEITLKEELTFVRKYIQVEKYRIHNSFQLEEDVEEELDLNAIKIFPFIIQPFIENAIKHAFVDSDSKHNQIILRIKKTAKYKLIIQIEDNGIGIKQEKVTKETNSRAIEIVSKRLELINGEKNSVVIDFRGENLGTLVTIKLNYHV